MTPGASKQARDLFAAARADGPDAAARDALWDRLAATTGIGSGAAGVGEGTAAKVQVAKAATGAAGQAAPAGATVATTAGAVKLVVAGVAVGALSTALGVVAVQSASDGPVVHVVPRVPHERVSVGADTGRASGARLATTEVRAKVSPAEVSEKPELGAPKAHAPVAADTAQESTNAESALAEEARLLTEARKALVRGEPAQALSLVEEVKRLPLRALQPEQMGIEARALRALGRTDDAAAVELRLRARFPEHALAR